MVKWLQFMIFSSPQPGIRSFYAYPIVNWVRMPCWSESLQVPCVVFDNSYDVTIRRSEALGKRLEQVLNDLWKLYQEK